MIMLSFRTSPQEVAAATVWAERLGIDRSELLREALHAYLVRLSSERDAETWERQPLTEEEFSVGEIVEWGPAEDWSDWAGQAG
jgi:hypothetical protein